MTDDVEPGPSKAEALAHEYALEDEALTRYPEIAKLGTFGDPAFESALDAAVEEIDGGPAVQLELDLEALGDA